CEVSRAKQEMPGTDNFESLAEYFGYRDEPKKLIKFFDVITGRQRVYLQVRLNDYASHLLSNFWGEVKDLNSDSDVIFDRIYADVSRMAVSFQKEVEAEELRLLARFLFCVSLRIAKNAQRFVTFAESHSYKGIKCSI